MTVNSEVPSRIFLWKPCAELNTINLTLINVVSSFLVLAVLVFSKKTVHVGAL